MTGGLPRFSTMFTVEENSDYLATEAHYLSLAARILAALRDSSGFSVLTRMA